MILTAACLTFEVLKTKHTHMPTYTKFTIRELRKPKFGVRRLNSMTYSHTYPPTFLHQPISYCRTPSALEVKPYAYGHNVEHISVLELRSI